MQAFFSAAAARAAKIRARYRQFGYDRLIPELKEIGS
jgi:hypothetical protein